MPLAGVPNSRDQIASLLERGVRQTFFEAYDNRGRQYQQIFNIDGSVKQQETDVVLAGIGLFPQKGEGQPYEYDAGQQAWTKVYKHTTFALGIQITREGK